MRTFRLVVLSAAAAALAAAGCASGDGPSSQAAPEARRATRFADCDAVKDYLVEAVAARAEISARYGTPPGDWLLGAPAAEGADATGAQPEGGAAAAGERDFSSTNVQEQGVDEPDYVKTDGDHLYVVTGGTFLVFRAWPAEDVAERSRVEIEGAPIALLVHRPNVLVLSRVWEPAPGVDLPPERPIGPWVKATVLDTTDPAEPRLLREIYLEGQYVDARMVDGRAHVVLGSRLPLADPPGLPSGGPELLGGSLAEDDDGAPADPPDLEAADISELLPRMIDRVYGEGGAAARVEAICPCDNMYEPAVPNGTGLITVVTLDLGAPTSGLGSVSLLSDSGVVYGSRESLYLATPNSGYWAWWPVLRDEAEAPRETTVIHKFDLTGSPAYVASGQVPGWVLNPFSMGEHEGVFRIATTEGGWWDGEDPVNGVYLLRQEGEALVETGSLKGLGEPGERIYAVRFLRDRGFVVTFRQQDPLYALDLSDPTEPRAAGELHVPGLSTYLHPVGDDLLLAVGQDTAPGARGVKLSLYDVGDLGSPREVAARSVGAGSHSEAQYNHKAFTYFDTLGVLALPVTTWEPGPEGVADVFAGVHLYEVHPDAPDPDGVFTLRGRIDHSVFYRDGGAGFWYYPEPVRRTFFIGEAPEAYFVYTISARGLKVTPYEDLESDVAALPLPAEDGVPWSPIDLALPAE